MIISEYTLIRITKALKVKPHLSRGQHKVFQCCRCDICGNIFEIHDKTRINRISIYGDKDACPSCNKQRFNDRLKTLGTKALKSFSSEDKKLYSSMGGKESQRLHPDNKGKFSTDRWNSMDDESKMIQVKRASKALHDKLNSDSDLRTKHYQKVYKSSKIGYTSAGHLELHKFLTTIGNFTSDYMISGMTVDECDIENKIVFEYNGDFYHCNPRSWAPDEYNTVIKMKAAEKWSRDRNRKYKLKSLGYSVFEVWEYDWKYETELIKQKIIDFYDKTREMARHRTIQNVNT